MTSGLRIGIVGCILLGTGGVFGGCKNENKQAQPGSAVSAEGKLEEARSGDKTSHPEAGGQVDGIPATASSDPECIGPWHPEGTPLKLEAGGHAFEITGSKLVETSKDDDAQITLGVIANIKEDTQENLANIRALLAFFAKQKAEAIVVVGDLGETEAQIKNVAEVIAGSGLLTFVVIGNREPKSDFKRAIDTVRTQFPNLINMNEVRLALLDDVALVSNPGYFNPEYIHSENGCAYTAKDLQIVETVIREAKDKRVVLVSHGPPRQEGTQALDRTLEQANVGDPELAKLLKATNVRFGLFANIQEAGGRATTLDGTRLIAENTPAKTLFLNPGPADAVSWKMNDETRSVGMGAIFKLNGDEASFVVERLPERK